MKTKISLVFGMFTLVILLSCSNSKEIQQDVKDVQTFLLNDTISIGLGELVLCESDLDLFIEFDSLISDSRCPIGAECFWEGNAEGKFAITYKKELEEISLNTNDPKTNTKEMFGFEIQLITINPYPGAKNAENEAKTAVLLVRKK